jgi:hypothetical protein
MLQGKTMGCVDRVHVGDEGIEEIYNSSRFPALLMIA